MATKTLGVKFEIAGVKEAGRALDNLRKNINQALDLNKKAGDDLKKKNISNKDLSVKFKVTGLKKSVEDYKKAVKRGFGEWKIDNFGSTSQKQNLTIKREKKEFRQRSTYRQIPANNRALVLEFRLAYKDFFGRLEQLLDDKQNPNIFEKALGFLGKPIGFAVDAIIFPFQSALAGMFERMGEVQVQDFAEGFNKKIQAAIGLSFEETGGDVGKIIGTSLYKVYQKSIDAVDSYVKGELKFNLADTLIEAFEHTTKTLAKELPAMALRTHRRIQINKKAIPEARKAAGLAMIENKLPEKTRADIEANKSITLVYGGANTDSADIGKDYTARVMKPYLKGSAVIPMTREWTNSAVDSEFQGDIRNLIKTIMKMPGAAKTFKGFVSENGLGSLGGAEQAELMQGLDIEGELDLSSVERMAEIIESLMGNKDFAMGKALQATFKGYNPDDVSGAAEAIALMEQFPDKDLQIGGFSHGGYNALGTVDLLNRMGYDNVKGFSIGTPITGANATVNPDNFKSFMGDRDYYYKALTGLAGDNIDFPEFFEVGEKEGSLHSLQGYVRGDNLRGNLQSFLGDRVSLPSKENYGKKDSAYGYAVGELGAETALIRTLLTYMGEDKLGSVNAKEGFVFSAEESLPGYTGNLKKLGRGLKDEDTKKFHAEYIDFLETLQEELEIAEQLAAIGKQYKPVQSLQKAANIFPQLETLAANNTESNLSPQELEAAQAEAAEKEKLVFFKRKVAQQKDNIERTFQAMLGRKFTKKDEQKGIYSFYEPEEYEERAGNFEGMVNWLENDILGGASEEEKAEAQPTLDLLKNITASIRETGSTGNLDLNTVRSAEELLGIDLREFNLLFKEFEGNEKEKLDTNKYKDQLRTLRRNRDQILNEKKTPQKVSESLEDARKKITAVDVEASEPVQLSTQELQSAFSEYLQKIIIKGTEYGTKVLRDNAADIEGNNFNENQVTAQFNELNEDFKKATGEYRKAVADGNNELATELAENLLFQSASLKRIYGELAGQIENEDTKSSVRGFRSYLTSVQTEITTGQPNLRGRVSQGLPSMLGSNTDLEARVREINFGSDIRDGVENIINRETGETIGYQFVLGINEGGQDAADINSPSKVWQWIGKMIKDGFAGGVSGIGEFLTDSLNNASDSAGDVVGDIVDSVSDLAQELDDSAGLLDPLFETEGADEEINNFFGGLIQKVAEVFEDLTDRFPVLGRIANFLMEIGGEVLQVLGIFSFGEALIQFSTNALAASMQLESLEKSILAVSSSAIDGAKNINFIRNEAKRLSIDLISAEESYKRILGATRNTPLEGLQTQQIFTTLATTAKNRGLNTDATNRLFLGFEQVIAKNEFKSEEVRGQLAEVLGDIQNLLATSVGVPISQLSSLMEAGDLKAAEVMPKLLAQLNAQNAAVGSSSQTAQAAQTRLNNAVLEFQDSVGRKLQPVQKMGLNNMAAALEILREKSQLLIKLAVGLVSTVLVNLIIKFLATRAAVWGLVSGINLLRVSILRLLPNLLIFAQKFILISAAIEVWTNNLKLYKNAFPELQDRIEASTKRLDALRKAFDDAGDAATNNSSKFTQLQLNEGLELPEWLQGIAGGERLNLDIIRRQLDKLYSVRGGKYLRYGPLGVFAKNNRPGFATQAKEKQADFVVGASDLISKTDRTLTYGYKAKGVLAEIAEIDKKARELQSKRLDILPGDNQALQLALAAEKEVYQERDKLLEKTAQYQQSLQGDIQDIKDTLLELDVLDRTGGNEAEKSQRANTRSALDNRLKDLKAEKKAIDDINSRIPKFLTQVDRLIRNSDERVSGFIANQGDDAIGNETEAIKKAISEGVTDADLEITLNNLSANDLEDRINFVNKEIKELEAKLESAYLQEGVEGLESAAAAQGLELTSDTLERMLEEGRSPQQTKAANLLLALDEYGGIVAQSNLELVNLLKSNTTKLQDYNRTISDYFFKINQQIKEAQLEAQRLISQIFYTDIKNRLRSAVAPGSNTFVNGIIDNVQSILDQASQVAEKVFGDQAAKLGFESESRSLETEMKDFIKQIGNAGDALENLVRRLNGGDSPSNSSSPSTDGLSKEGSSVAKNALSWQGKHFKKGVYAMCAGFVRQVLKDSGVDVGVTKNPYDAGKQPNNGELMARSFFGSDIGTVFKDKSQAQAGDIIGFFDTYQYGQQKGSITHVGVYQGNDMMVDRSTSSAPVRHRSIDTFGKGNYIFVRPNQYQDEVSIPNTSKSKSGASSGVNQRGAIQKTKELIALKQQNLSITQRTTEQERESLQIAVEQTIEANKRQLEDSKLENARNLLGLETKFTDFGSSYGYQSATKEAASALRNIRQQFLDADLDVSNQISNTEDAIKTITNQIPVLNREIGRLKAIGTPEALGAVKVSEAALLGLKQSLPGLKSNLTRMQSIQSDSAALETKSTKFVEYQNKLKIEQERINKRSLLVNQKATIAEQRGTLEAQRQLKLHQEDLRLTLKINELRQQNAPGEYLDSLIAGERRQAQVNTDNISYDSEIAELDLEKQLLDLNSGVGDKNAGFLSRYGFNLQADKIKRDNAIAQENLRFERELIELRKQYVDRPEELEKFARAATQLNRVNLKSIEQEFKSLGMTIEGLFIESTQGFFNQVATNFFDGKEQRDSQLTQEKLRYAEELVQLENQYRDAPGQLAHMKNRARELNEQKLDKINSEFNIFSRVVELAGQTILEFTKQIAAMLAQQAAAKFISSILGAAVGGATGGGVSSVGNDFGSGASYSAFTADEGVTVGDVRNYKNGDTINSRRLNNRTSSLLKSNFPGVAKAFAAEGEGAEIGVFHTGEELLSRKTGEAGRYQGLKARYGINPLEKILNYSDGGTVGGFDAEANILSGFSRGGNRIDLSGLDEARRNNSGAGTSKTLNITQQIFTPNQDSFVLNADQRNQDLMESLKRGF